MRLESRQAALDQAIADISRLATNASFAVRFHVHGFTLPRIKRYRDAGHPLSVQLQAAVHALEYLHGFGHPDDRSFIYETALPRIELLAVPWRQRLEVRVCKWLDTFNDKLLDERVRRIMQAERTKS